MFPIHPMQQVTILRLFLRLLSFRYDGIVTKQTELYPCKDCKFGALKNH